jgi:hypothetical protein
MERRTVVKKTKVEPAGEDEMDDAVSESDAEEAEIWKVCFVLPISTF